MQHDGAGVQAFVEQHHAHPGGRVPFEDRPLHRRRATPSRQQGEVEVEAAEVGNVQDRGGQELSVGDDHEGIGREVFDRLGAFA